LHVNPKIVAGILETLTLHPTQVTAGGSSVGVVTLYQAVPFDTVVSLGVAPAGSHFPQPGGAPAYATVPQLVTIQAGRTSATFTVSTNHNAPPHTTQTVMAAAIDVKYAMLTVTG
jgi:hypothetical protein